jgi:prolyl-tRNA synthetase
LDYHCKNININRDYTPSVIADIRNVVEGDTCKICGKELKFCRGIEVGHTFKLGTKYSKSMNAVYLNPEGKETLMIMGCYGIGVSRIVAATIEQSHDENGIIWPLALAPFQVSIIAVDLNHAATKAAAEKLHDELSALGIEVLFDDRDERAGVKFKDADLMGIPLRLTISEKTLAQGSVEFKLRQEDFKSAKLIALDKIVEEIKSLCKEAGLKI